MIQVEKKKMGRPTDNPKNYRESFRLSETDMGKIKFCMEKTGMSKTEIIRMGINEFYHKNKKYQTPVLPTKHTRAFQIEK